MTQGLQLQLGGSSDAATPLTLLLAADHTTAGGGVRALPCSSEKLGDLGEPAHVSEIRSPVVLLPKAKHQRAEGGKERTASNSLFLFRAEVTVKKHSMTERGEKEEVYITHTLTFTVGFLFLLAGCVSCTAQQ